MLISSSGIEIKNVSKKFENQMVLEQVNLVCPSGEITGLIGRNGSGKSVLLKCICDMLKCDEGEIWINGEKNTEYIDGGKQIGAVIEEPSFLSRYSGLDNLLILYGLRNSLSKEKVIKAMVRTGLDPWVKKPVGKYSLGMKQKLAITQAIMEDQEILLLDEPMNGLDRTTAKKIRKLLIELKKAGKTIVLASHNKEDIEELCDRVYLIESGSINEQENLTQIK